MKDVFPRVRRACRGRGRFFPLCVALLAGCAAMPPRDGPAVASRRTSEAFLLEGRFSLRQDEQNYSGRLSWRHAADGDELLLASPFGQGIAEISARPGQAALTTGDGQTFTAPDVPSLTERALGYRLPLQRLADWVRGRAADAEIAARDARGRPLRLRHEDWRIEYGYEGDDPLALPASVFAERSGTFELRLRIDGWGDLPPGEDAP
jgi:outer membrane lipoprotein LolB